MITRRTLFALAPFIALNGAPEAAFVRVSPRDRRYLELSDGAPYIPVGLNLIAPPEQSKDGTPGLGVYEKWLDRLSANGGNYVRAWLSNSFWDVEHAKSGEFDEAKAQRIDALFLMARRRGIRVKATIEHFRSIGAGTQPWADKPLHHRSNGGPAESIADFFDGEKSRAQFRKKLEWLGTRFGNRAEVFGWELWNEVNAVRGGDYLAWTELMLAELHRRFPRNLCMQSLGSFDTAAVRETYRRHSRMAGNDLAQVHRYLDLGASLDACKGPVDVLAADAVREVSGYEPDKPVILAESGAVEPRHSGPFKLYSADRDGTLLHDILFAPFFAGAAGPGQIWHWDAYVDRNDLWWQFGRFAEIVKGIDPAAEAFAPSLIPHDRLRAYRLEGRRTTLIWCRDVRNDWRSELEKGEAPAVLSGLRIEHRVSSSQLKTRAYDPWSGDWSNASHDSGRISLPDFRRSIILQIS